MRYLGSCFREPHNALAREQLSLSCPRVPGGLKSGKPKKGKRSTRTYAARRAHDTLTAILSPKYGFFNRPLLGDTCRGGSSQPSQLSDQASPPQAARESHSTEFFHPSLLVGSARESARTYDGPFDRHGPVAVVAADASGSRGRAATSRTRGHAAAATRRGLGVTLRRVGWLRRVGGSGSRCDALGSRGRGPGQERGLAATLAHRRRRQFPRPRPRARRRLRRRLGRRDASAGQEFRALGAPGL